MKCPKCGYISFDFNQVCPKCNKDISDMREKMGFPSYRPSPPSLLGALIGEAGDSAIGLSMEGGAEPGMVTPGVDFSPEDSQAIEAMEETFQNGEGLELPSEEGSEELDIADLITVSPEDIGGEEAEGETGVEEGLEDLELGDISGEEEATAVPEEAEEEAVSLDMEDLELEAEPALDDSQELELDLELEPEEGIDATLSEEDVTLESDTDSAGSNEPGEIDLSDTLDIEDKTAAYDSSDLKDEKTQVILDEEDAVDMEDLDLDLELEGPEK